MNTLHGTKPPTVIYRSAKVLPQVGKVEPDGGPNLCSKLDYLGTVLRYLPLLIYTDLLPALPLYTVSE